MLCAQIPLPIGILQLLRISFLMPALQFRAACSVFFHGDLQVFCATGELERAMSRSENSSLSSGSSYLSLLKACAKRKSLSIAKRLHAHFADCLVDVPRSLGEHLVLALSRCGAYEEALSVLHRLPHRTAFSWTAIISSLTDSLRAHDALSMHQRMVKDGVDPDPYTFVALFKACGLVSNLESGHAGEGNFAACHWMFEELQLVGLKPDEITFTSLLTSCSHVGFVDEGAEYFVLMSTHHGVLAESTHYVCMVDLFGRAGDFARVDSILKRMKKHDALAMWSSLMSACCTHGNVEMGNLVFLHSINVQPEDTIAYVLMSNMQANAGMQDWGNA